MPRSHNALTRIVRTLEFYDPGRKSLVIGTAALALQGIELDVPDVDVLADEAFIANLRHGPESRRIRGSSFFDTSQEHYDFAFKTRILLRPNPARAAYGILPFQAFYKISDELYATNFTYEEPLAVVTPSGHLAMPAARVIDWKEAVGRPKDLATLAAIGRVSLHQLVHVP